MSFMAVFAIGSDCQFFVIFHTEKLKDSIALVVEITVQITSANLEKGVKAPGSPIQSSLKAQRSSPTLQLHVLMVR